MRIIELDIHNVRGICDLNIKPNGGNFVAWGPNGSGKSALVDAIDFLLTGRIGRLMGKGTGGITLGEHGPHIDHKPKDAVVHAIIQLPGLKESVEIQRCMENPSKLQFKSDLKQYLDPVLLLAQRGQHVLTRREILRFVTSEASRRAEQIQELLNIEEIEKTRKILVNIKNEFEADVGTEKQAVNRAQGEIIATAQIQTFSEDMVLQFVNQNRTLLGGKPLLKLIPDNVKTGLTAPTLISTGEGHNITLLERDIQNLRNVMSQQNKEQIAKADAELRELITGIKSDPQLLRALTSINLTKLGLTLIDSTGSCPLCDTAWPAGKLQKYLEERFAAAQDALEKQKQISGLSQIIANNVNSILASLNKIISLTKDLSLEKELSILESWSIDLENLSSSLADAMNKFPNSRFDSKRVQQMMAPDTIISDLKNIYDTAKIKYPETTPEHNAWDILTRITVNLEALQKAENRYRDAELLSKKASILHDSFIFSRDLILENLYNSIRDRFVDLYRTLHGIDEESFTAQIKPQEAGLDFQVDFYGRGIYPPHALHSEGHQDSMGLCLYLALSERLTKDTIDLVILDDVVMSVDADHRRAVCSLIGNCFPNRQFLITTHDRTWANQLRTDKIVHKKNVIEFYNWHVDTGPLVGCEPDMWEKIDVEIKRNNISDASARLRRGSEQFFSEVCSSLQAKVIYKLNSQWELGDFLPAAMDRYRELLKQAKSAANSWNDNDSVDKLKELDSTRAQIYARSGAEQWAINANIHYNNWANFLEKDFRPVVDAFQDLYNLFTCSSCGGLLFLVSKETKLTSVRCNCGKVNINLVEKDKAG